MNAYNRYSDRAVIVSYPIGAGGKFIINCLGISKHCYLQHFPLILQQRNGNLSPKDKLDFLCQQLDKTTDQWTDLWLGDATVFGDAMDPSIWREEINQISYENCYFFTTAHTPEEARKLISIWPKSKKIVVTNPESFINFRNPLVDVKRDLNSFSYRLIPDSIEWDSSWNLNTDTVLEQIEILYNRFGIDDFNSDFVARFARKYLEVIKRLKELT